MLKLTLIAAFAALFYCTLALGAEVQPPAAIVVPSSSSSDSNVDNKSKSDNVFDGEVENEEEDDDDEFWLGDDITAEEELGYLNAEYKHVEKDCNTLKHMMESIKDPDLAEIYEDCISYLKEVQMDIDFVTQEIAQSAGTTEVITSA